MEHLYVYESDRMPCYFIMDWGTLNYIWIISSISFEYFIINRYLSKRLFKTFIFLDYEVCVFFLYIWASVRA